jgi:hypothetical protein
MNITINGHVNIFTDSNDDDTHCHKLEDLLYRTLLFVPGNLCDEIKEVLK